MTWVPNKDPFKTRANRGLIAQIEQIQQKLDEIRYRAEIKRRKNGGWEYRVRDVVKNETVASGRVFTDDGEHIAIDKANYALLAIIDGEWKDVTKEVTRD